MQIVQGRSLTDSQPPRKRARTAQSSPESEEEYMDEDVNVSDMDIGGDDDFVVDDEPAGKKGKSRAGRGGNKRKGKLDGSAHKKAPGEKPRGADATSGTKRPRPSLKPKTAFPSAQAKDGSPVPPIPKKRKLPTIKKNKSSASGGSGTPSSLAASTPKPSASGTPQQKSVLPDAGNKGGRAAALGGNTDLDLTDKSVYAELFKGGSSQRNASTRRTKEEERRRELDKMRDDARAKREEEAKQSFDLQAQYEKISKFEERLRQDKNPVLYPNQLGIKLRVQWDMEHMARKERRGQENGDLNGREEGEMNESPMRR
ncbi:hypothetical protein BDQ17DRAFT_1353530 [Cyathus striatus]|nr:hypothetical protein BDQ17DRAFT_1353530 [Cyathus striatus]